ncbi:MAG: NUDIX hydrolase [Thermoleophilaceae bacterium]|nr:NUDIX hydrolase [Thermoleophilaceae bacterium]
MRVDRPPPGERLHDGPEVTPRLAASVVVMRHGQTGPEILFVQRHPDQRFMGGVWVFPGGAVDAGEEPPATAVRELEEEAAIALDPEAELIPFVRWITPKEVSIRFDTWFFLTEAPPGQEGRCDGQECIDLRWLTAPDALAAHERDELMLVFPTIRTLQRLAGFESVEVALSTLRATDTESITPRIIVKDDHAEVLLPGEPGYA